MVIFHSYFDITRGYPGFSHNTWRFTLLAQESRCDAVAPRTTPRRGHHAAEMALHQVEPWGEMVS